MKKLILIMLALMLCFMSFGQQKVDTLHIDSIYENVNELLITSKVLTFDSLSKVELINRFESWGGQYFRNYDEVKTSKTDNQITLLYISNSYICKWYVILIAEFKDNKIRLKFIDDGNTFIPAIPGNQYSHSTASRTYFFRTYFENGMLIYKTKPGTFNGKEQQVNGNSNGCGMLGFKKSIDLTIKNIEDFINNKIITDENDNW